VRIFTAPDTEADEEHYDAVDTDEAWLITAEWAGRLLMPLIATEE
jgi:hypothetical protein